MGDKHAHGSVVVKISLTVVFIHTHTHKQTQRKLEHTHSSLTGKISSSDFEQILTHARAQNVQKHPERWAHTACVDYAAEPTVSLPSYTYRFCFCSPVIAYRSSSPFPSAEVHISLFKLRFYCDCGNLKVLKYALYSLFWML